MARVQHEEGLRNEVHDQHKGFDIRVVSAYDARGDNWCVHAYLSTPGSRERRLDSLSNARADTAQQGIDLGFDAATSEIDRAT